MYVFQEPKANPADSDNVRVVVRCRPMNAKEKETHCKQTVNVSASVETEKDTSKSQFAIKVVLSRNTPHARA